MKNKKWKIKKVGKKVKSKYMSKRFKIISSLSLIFGLYLIVMFNLYQTTKVYDKVQIKSNLNDNEQLNQYTPVDICSLDSVLCKYKEVVAKITGYNTISAQTDSTPCWAGGYYICGRNDVVACPRWIEKETWVRIDGKFYQCLDRLALKYDNRFDISCDKDMECPYKVTGIKTVEIYK